jgi:hypothetical protein
MRFLLHALGEGPLEMGPLLAATFLYIIDSPRTRAYLNVGTDLEVRAIADFATNLLNRRMKFFCARLRCQLLLMHMEKVLSTQIE